MVLYGIPNCNTMKKARSWLDAHGLDYRFHNYRKDGVDAELLNGWVAQVGWEALLNRRGTTWRRLPDEEKCDLDAQRAVALMCEHPAMIKRPVLQLDDGTIVVGFAESDYEARLA